MALFYPDPRVQKPQVRYPGLTGDVLVPILEEEFMWMEVEDVRGVFDARVAEEEGFYYKRL